MDQDDLEMDQPATEGEVDPETGLPLVEEEADVLSDDELSDDDAS